MGEAMARREVKRATEEDEERKGKKAPAVRDDLVWCARTRVLAVAKATGMRGRGPRGPSQGGVNERRGKSKGKSNCYSTVVTLGLYRDRLSTGRR